MKVLIGCEFSAVVRDAFRKRGHDAWSCDLLPCEGDEKWHLRGDVFDCIANPTFGEPWDLLIAFPPCTHLSASGAVYWKTKQADGRQQAAIKFVRRIYNAGITHVAIENPTGILSTVWRKPDQIIHPFQFGDPYMKRTCLWLKNLPPLETTREVEPIAHWHGGVRRGGIKKDGTRTPSKLPTALKYGMKDRSRTFLGIARAMAEQWGSL
jgi:site-specific DNA-cytosine methylase